MWVIHEEMNRMAQTISLTKFVFSRLHESPCYGGLTELNNEYHDELTKLNKSRSSRTYEPSHWNLKLLD